MCKSFDTLNFPFFEFYNKSLKHPKSAKKKIKFHVGPKIHQCLRIAVLRLLAEDPEVH